MNLQFGEHPYRSHQFFHVNHQMEVITKKILLLYQDGRQAYRENVWWAQKIGLQFGFLDWNQDGCVGFFTPQIINFNRGFPYFHHPFGGFFPLFLEIPNDGIAMRLSRSFFCLSLLCAEVPSKTFRWKWFKTMAILLGCPRKLGSMVSKWIITYL